jgi:hypothetical protein
MIMNSKISKLAAIILSLIFLTGCSAGSMSAEDLAARETDSDASLWDEEDYKTIAAKACIKYKVVFNNALGDWYADWSRLGTEYTLVGLTSGALDDHPKWDPIARTVRQSTTNALSRAAGGAGVEVSSDVAVQAFNLCEELGVDLTE